MARAGGDQACLRHCMTCASPSSCPQLTHASSQSVTSIDDRDGIRCLQRIRDTPDPTDAHPAQPIAKTVKSDGRALVDQSRSRSGKSAPLMGWARL